MWQKIKNSQSFKRVFYFFPLQLLFVHLKKNQVLLIFWLLIYGFISGNIAEKYGASNLFLHPEYLGKSDFWSYLIVGFAFGGFIMAYNISSYIINGFRFQFLATLSKPFLKYCLNNALLPLIFIIFYIIKIVETHISEGYNSNITIILNIISFITGNLFFIFLSLSYFLTTNKDIFKLFGIITDDGYGSNANIANPVKDVFHKKEKWLNNSTKTKEWKVETYLTQPFKVSLARDCSHYDNKMLEGVFHQNNINAAYFQIAVIISLLVLGFFREVRIFMIPAGATVFLLFTMLLMLASALHSWVRGWSTSIYIALFLLFNFISGQDFFNYENQIFGMNYNTEKVIYSNENLLKHAKDKKVQQIDFENNIEILNKWRIKNSTNTIERQKKPKFVIVCSSGGGLRASLWSLHSIQHADSILKGQLLNHTQMMCGSSGGMIGAAYLREIYLRSQNDKSVKIHNPLYKEKIAHDLLNPIIFTAAVNDMFIRLQKFKDGEYTYVKDRGYAFEKQLNQNTDNFLNKRLREYHKPEKEGKIPLLMFTPTIINDGRRLLVASQPVSYMTNNEPLQNMSNIPLPETIEYSRFFKNQDADNIWFTSALRMNATFPYIFPVVSLPSKPAIEIMDGGIRDNYGIKTALLYLFKFRNWISSNTSGVVIVQTRDKYKELEVENNPTKTNFQSLTGPLGSFYGNFDKIQNFNNDEVLQYVSAWFDGQIDVVDFQLKNDEKLKISMSWHLTPQEKKNVIEAIYLKENQDAIKKLQTLLN